MVMMGCAHDPPPQVEDPSSCTTNCFDQAAATHALDQAAVDVQKCASTDDSEKNGTAQITFDPSGHVSAVTLDAHLEHSAMADCIKTAFRKSVVPAFQGDAQTVAKIVSISR